jgi:hypothetical protein
LPQITIDDDDLFGAPAQSHSVLAESILPLRAFRVLEDLANRRLPNVQVGVAFQVTRIYFLVSI